MATMVTATATARPVRVWRPTRRPTRALRAVASVATADELRARADALAEELHPSRSVLRQGGVRSAAAAPCSSGVGEGRPPLLLYRDTNAWCPFCERVWMALEYKHIAHDVEFISLMGSKPDWYKELVPTGKVPAARFASDDAVVWESDVLLRELEARFPDAPPLVPRDDAERERMERFLAEEMEGDGALTAVGYRYLSLFGGERDPAELQALRAELDAAVSRVQPYFEHGFIAGGDAMTLADVMVAPGLERLAANLPIFRDYHLREELAPWFEAMEGVAAYQAVRSDPETHNLVARQIFGLAGGKTRLPAPRMEAATARGAAEAGARLASNLDAVVGDAMKNAGVDAAQRAAVEMHLRVLAGSLLDAAEAGGDVAAWRPVSPCPRLTAAEKKRLAEAGEDAEEADRQAARAARAAGAAALAFVRNRVSAPRDMTAEGAVAFRAACDAFLQAAY